jgi:predicted acyltransferase
MLMVEVKQRLQSLDTFRGITIMMMILVNNPGSWSHVYPPLRHAAWHGWTPTDFVFPFFLFIVGISISLSFTSRLERGQTRSQIFLKALRRSIIIFAIGFVLNLFPEFDFSDVRIMGVLQRIALCYALSSVIILTCRKTTQVGVAICILIIYWIAMKTIPVPGYGAGILDPQGNLCWYFDSRLLAGHTWKGAPVPGFDPEGLLSTLPAAVTTLLGVFTGDWLRSDRNSLEKVSGLFVFGNIGLIVGVIMNIWFPINKPLWTSSYVVFMAGMALHFLAMCFWLIEIKAWRQWAKPFIVFGSNAILVFVLSSLMARILTMIRIPSEEGMLSLKTAIFENCFASWAGPLNGSLFFAVFYILLWLGLMSLLYRKRIFIKI